MEVSTAKYWKAKLNKISMLEFQGKGDSGNITTVPKHLRLLERDERACRNNLQLLTSKQYPSRINPLARKKPEETHTVETIIPLSRYRTG